MKSTTRSWRDSMSMVAFALSLTAFMASALFVMVGLNPKSEGFGNSPWYYGAICLLSSPLLYLLSQRLNRGVSVETGTSE